MAMEFLKMITANNSKANGEWEGKGKFVHSNSIYQGQFKNFLKDGHGE